MDKGEFITNLYRTYTNGVLWEKDTVNRIKNSFLRVHMKKYPQTHSTAREHKATRNRMLHKNLVEIPKF